MQVRKVKQACWFTKRNKLYLKKNKMDNQLIKTVGIAVAINIILPKLVKPFATEDEIKPPSGNALSLIHI